MFYFQVITHILRTVCVQNMNGMCTEKLFPVHTPFDAHSCPVHFLLNSILGHLLCVDAPRTAYSIQPSYCGIYSIQAFLLQENDFCEKWGCPSERSVAIDRGTIRPSFPSRSILVAVPVMQTGDLGLARLLSHTYTVHIKLITTNL